MTTGRERECWTYLVQQLGRSGLTLSVAESLTGGRLADAIVTVPGASAVFAGGAVTYSERAKIFILGISEQLLDAGGAVQPEVAEQMAEAARRRFDTDLALATTGVAGPGPADGHPAGTVYISLATSGQTRTEAHLFTGNREHVRSATVSAAAVLLERWLDQDRQLG